MGGKFAVFTLAFVFSSVGLKAEDDYGVSFSDYTYTGSNGCSSFGACDSNWSTVTDNSGLQSSGWQFDGNSWMVGFTPGQLQSLGPSFADQFNSIQTRMQQAWQSLKSFDGVDQETVHNALELGTIDLRTVELLDLKPFGYEVNPLFGMLLEIMSQATTPELGTQYFPGITIDPAALPLPARSGSADLSSISGDTWPFTTVDPGSVTIVDPPFRGDRSTIIDLNRNIDPGNVTIVDPPSITGDPSTIIDLNSDAEAQQMLLRAKQSQSSLISEQQQLQSQVSQYQSQSQQALNHSTLIFQSAFDRAFSNAVGNISGYRLQGGSTATTGNAWQSLASTLNGFSKIGQSVQPTRLPTVPATRPKVAGPQGCARASDAEGVGACQLVQDLVRIGVIRPAPVLSWMLNTPATQSTTPPLTLGPTGVKCQTDAKGRTTCTGTLPSWMH